MNGSTGTSSSSSENRGYPGGIPPPGGHLLGPVGSLGGSLGSMGMGGAGVGGPQPPGGPPPPPGLGGLPPGSVGAAAAAAAAAGLGVGSPEFKNHADFLSRLLAATPSYMNEVGNPPPGFFSDWLRRLVSKPTGNGSSGSLQAQGLTFPGVGGQSEVESGGRPRSGGGEGGGGGSSGGRGGNIGNGSSSSSGVPSTTPNSSSLDAQMSSKRRKRSRLSDHPEHPLGVTIHSFWYQ